ncbi:MAG: class I SAM-dependent RNA methyltransferase, partial [Lachnospiraceae bacterium]
MEFKKNDRVTVTIEDVGTEGEGIGKIEGFTLFIKDAVIGDTVEAKIIKSKKHYAYARLEKVISPSPFRVQPPCACHRQCGGCQIQAMDYAKQLEFKQNKVKNNLLRIGGFTEEEIEKVMEPIVGMEEPYHYRNKAQYPVGRDKEGNPIAGFYAGRTHSIIANTDCLLGREENKEILETILTYMREFHVEPYDEESGQGLVRHIL